MHAIQAWFSANPGQAAAILSLLGALGVNWGLGVIGALVRGTFDFQQLPRILESQFASTEVRVIFAMVWASVGTSLLTGLLDVYLKNATVDSEVAAISTIFLGALAAASGLYSAAVWHEDVVALLALLRGTQPLPSKLLTRRTAVTNVTVHNPPA